MAGGQGREVGGTWQTGRLKATLDGAQEEQV